MVKSIDTIKNDVFSLKVGMFVSKLDIPWSSTDFPIKGFMIEDRKQIDQLIGLCNHVYVDVERSSAIESCKVQPLHFFDRQKIDRLNTNNKYIVRPATGMSNAHLTSRISSLATATYAVSSSLKKEIKVASLIIADSSEQLARILTENHKLSLADLSHLKQLTSSMVASAIRNPDALVWLCKIKKSNKQVYSSVLSSAVSGMLFGRQIGLTRDKIEVLSQALIFRGIGLVKLEKGILENGGYDSASHDFLAHINLSLKELNAFYDCDPLVINTIQNYCERFDGEGFPTKKPAHRIPLLAQMMGIVSFYESLVNPMTNVPATAPSVAITKLFSVSNKQYSKHLIENFVQSVGLYPVGCLVELSNKSVGMVIEHTPKQRLRPKLALIQDRQGNYYRKPKLVDLAIKKYFHGISISRGISVDTMPEEVFELCRKIQRSKSKLSMFLELIDKLNPFSVKKSEFISINN